MKKLLAGVFLVFVGLFSLACSGSGVSTVSSYNPAAVSITGGTITGTTSINSNTYSSNGKLLHSSTNPTMGGGFGTGASITPQNGTSVFQIYVGSGGIAGTGNITMPAAPTGWDCFVGRQVENAANTGFYTVATGTTQTNVTVTNYNASFVAAAWATDINLRLHCTPY